MSLSDVQAVKASNLVQANLKIQSRLLDQNKNMQQSLISRNRSQALIDETASNIFTENWANLNNWVTPATSGVQVSGNQLFSTGTQGSGSGANHSLQLGSTESMRAIFNVNIPSKGSSGGIIIGVSQDAAGAIPTAGAGKVFGIYFQNTLLIMNNGATSNPNEVNTYPAGNYIVTLTVDSSYISVSAVKTDGTVGVTARQARSTFPVNNLFVYNSDTRGLSGYSIGLLSVRRSLQTLIPRAGVEGLARGVQWSGDGTQSWRIYLPLGYDHRVPAPVVICFHGDGTNEWQWSVNANMSIMKNAFLNAGFIVLSCAYDSNWSTWGNTNSTNAYLQAYKYLKNNYSISSVVFYANSMGGIESLNALSDNFIPCNAWVGTSPTYNLAQIYQSNVNTFTSEIQAAYGVASDGSNYASQTAGRDPNLMSPYKFRCLPMMIIAAADDTVISKTENGDKLAATVQNTSIELQKIDVSSGGHSFDVTSYSTQIVNFLSKYSWF